MRRGSNIICSVVLVVSCTNRLDCGPLKVKIRDNPELVHVYFGDSDPYAAASEVNHHICMVTNYYFQNQVPRKYQSDTAVRLGGPQSPVTWHWQGHRAALATQYLQ